MRVFVDYVVLSLCHINAGSHRLLRMVRLMDVSGSFQFFASYDIRCSFFKLIYLNFYSLWYSLPSYHLITLMAGLIGF